MIKNLIKPLAHQASTLSSNLLWKLPSALITDS